MAHAPPVSGGVTAVAAGTKATLGNRAYRPAGGRGATSATVLREGAPSMKVVRPDSGPGTPRSVITALNPYDPLGSQVH